MRAPEKDIVSVRTRLQKRVTAASKGTTTTGEEKQKRGNDLPTSRKGPRIPSYCQGTSRTVEAAVEKGAHKMATSEESIKLVQQEDVAYYQVKAGYAKVHTWRDRQKL
jgi:DNA-binding LytR/AlgR family response regulator